jgi:hypothetical protein
VAVTCNTDKADPEEAVAPLVQIWRWPATTRRGSESAGSTEQQAAIACNHAPGNRGGAPERLPTQAEDAHDRRPVEHPDEAAGEPASSEPCHRRLVTDSHQAIKMNRHPALLCVTFGDGWRLASLLAGGSRFPPPMSLRGARLARQERAAAWSGILVA